jgi:hypothetical protein
LEDEEPIQDEIGGLSFANPEPNVALASGTRSRLLTPACLAREPSGSTDSQVARRIVASSGALVASIQPTPADQPSLSPISDSAGHRQLLASGPMRPRMVRLISAAAGLLAVAALVIELTVSHGWADMFWFLFAVFLLVSSYALRHHARSQLLYGSDGVDDGRPAASADPDGHGSR